MKIHDISQELFTSVVFPGDPVPKKETILSLEKENPDPCQLTVIQMGSHNGTHLDAPSHFYAGGRDVEGIELERCIGKCKVVSGYGEITGDFIKEHLLDGTKRLLIKGDIVITEEGAQAMVDCGLLTLGVEGLTVGPMESPKAVHLILLGAEIVIIEGLRMQVVSDGNYFLSALPLRMKGLDGSPVRAVLVED